MLSFLVTDSIEVLTPTTPNPGRHCAIHSLVSKEECLLSGQISLCATRNGLARPWSTRRNNFRDTQVLALRMSWWSLYSMLSIPAIRWRISGYLVDPHIGWNSFAGSHNMVRIPSFECLDSAYGPLRLIRHSRIPNSASRHWSRVRCHEVPIHYFWKPHALRISLVSPVFRSRSHYVKEAAILGRRPSNPQIRLLDGHFIRGAWRM